MNDRLSQAVVTGALCVLAIAAYTSLHGGGGAPEAQASNTQSSKGMHVSGVGTVTLHPDQATIVFTTKGRGTSLAAAENLASRTMRSLISTMQAGGVARTDLQTAPAHASKLNSQSSTYVAEQQLTVTVRTPSKAGQLVAKGVNAGAHSTVGPTFSIGDQQKAYDDALAAAVKQARSKADAIAAASGVRVTGIVSVDEGGSPYPYPYAGYTASVPGDTLQAARAFQVPTRAGMRQVEAQVNVVFAYG
jgi:uncharacterized protein YggE